MKIIESKNEKGMNEVQGWDELMNLERKYISKKKGWIKRNERM